MEKVDFNKEVLEKSYTKPVLVDFWAAWCGPCQFLGPIIEELYEGAKGEWELVKIKTEDNPELAEAYKIMSIPTVRLYHKGKQLAEFVGALPKFQIVKWLQQHLPDPRKEELNKIKTLKGQEFFDQLKSFVDTYPDYEESKVLLAKQYLVSDPEKSLELISGITVLSKFHEEAESIKTIGELLHLECTDDPIAEHLKKSTENFKLQKFDNCLEELIEAVQVNKYFCNELPRRATIAVFKFLGENSPISKKYRKPFDMALY